MLVILVLSATLGVLGVDGYLTHATQSARDSVARTIFMAAQTSLTHEYNQDRDFYQRTFPVVPDMPDTAPHFLPAGEPEKQAGAYPQLVYLTYDPGTPKSSQKLYAMLAPYINDKSILDNTILIEFNRATGMMLSAFYTELDTVTSFGYGSGDYNVINRDSAALVAHEIGFYGVDSTGDVLRGLPIDSDYRLRLVDYTNAREKMYGLLTAEIALPKKGLVKNLTHTLVLSSSGGADETITFGSTAGMAGVDFTIEGLRNDHIDTVEEAFDKLISRGGGKKCVAYVDMDTLIIVLDCVQSFDPSGTAVKLGILENYPNLRSGVLTAALDISDGTDVETVFSDSTTPVHTLYAGGSAPADNRMEVTSVRHLNNVRYCDGAVHFVQTQSVHMLDYRLHTLNFTPISNIRDVWKDAAGAEHTGFAGTYTSSANHAIYDLHIDLTGQVIPENPGEDDTTLYNAGLFDTVLSGGGVENVRFATSNPIINPEVTAYDLLRALTFENPNEKELTNSIASVQGIKRAGGIAAVNSGTIENCTMLGYVSADMSQNGVAGGVAGENSNGTIAKCASACTVSADSCAGGIAGTSDGTIRFCEAGTASWRSSTNSLELYLSGAAAYGAAEGVNNVYRLNHTANNTFRVKSKENNGAAGGVVGRVSGANAKVTGCVNACKVEAGNLLDDAQTGQVTGCLAGGIVGDLDGTDAENAAVRYSYNAGAVYATFAAGGVVGESNRGTIAFCYNTGCVNREYAYKDYKYDGESKGENRRYYLPGVTRNAVERAGGLLGLGSEHTAINDCYSMQYAGGQYGGAFGMLDERAQVENCSFLMNILNNTRTYRTGTGRNDFRADAVNALRMYSAENMRKAPSDGNLGSYFADGDFVNPMGVFAFKFPHLAGTVDGESLRIHRTPWNPTLEDYGEIKFTKGSLAGTRTEIICEFYIAPPEGKIILQTNSSDGEHKTTIIPLVEPTGYNSLADCRINADNGKWYDVYGYRSDSYDDAHRNYTVQIRASKLDPKSETDAKKIAAGYTYRYELRLYYNGWAESGTPYHTAIPADTTELIAELYNTNKAVGNGYVDEDKLGNSDALTIIDPSLPGTLVETRALRMSIDRTSANQSTRITFTYADGRKQIVLVPGSNSAAGSFITTMTLWPYYNNSRVGFTTDEVHHSTYAKRFPYYISEGKVYLVLWSEYDIWPGDQINRVDPNGLITDSFVTVTVERLHANGNVEATFSRTFNNLKDVQN